MQQWLIIPEAMPLPRLPRLVLCEDLEKSPGAKIEFGLRHFCYNWNSPSSLVSWHHGTQEFGSNEYLRIFHHFRPGEFIISYYIILIHFTSLGPRSHPDGTTATMAMGRPSLLLGSHWVFFGGSSWQQEILPTAWGPTREGSWCCCDAGLLCSRSPGVMVCRMGDLVVSHCASVDDRWPLMRTHWRDGVSSRPRTSSEQVRESGDWGVSLYEGVRVPGFQLVACFYLGVSRGVPRQGCKVHFRMHDTKRGSKGQLGCWTVVNLLKRD